MTSVIKSKIKKWNELSFFVPITEAVSVGNDFVIRGVAITETTTRNGHKFMADELKKSAKSLRDRPLLKDHNNSVDSIVGRTTKSKYDDENKNIPFEAKVMDEKMREMISDGRITSVSVGAMVKDMEEDEKNNVLIARGIEFVELSLVAVPADPDAGFARAMMESWDLKNKDCTKIKSIKEDVKMVEKKEVKEEVKVPVTEKPVEDKTKVLQEEVNALKEKMLEQEKVRLEKQIKENEEAEKEPEKPAEPEAPAVEEPEKEEPAKPEDNTEGEVTDGKEEDAVEQKFNGLFIGEDTECTGTCIYRESYEDSDIPRLRPSAVGGK